MSLSLNPASFYTHWKLQKPTGSVVKPSLPLRTPLCRDFRVKAFFFNPNPTEDPILKDALKEPVAFMGGMFAGILRLDLNEDPLREWVTRTVEASGITEEEIDAEGSKLEEEVPQQIEIE
ncbi:hypothetical protein L1049_000044 [Liquidambar formosana]|uniref:Uncharacterized protein n=1 Tax=Liquidambar formosana TaxID=63359 RepID=A0AAP0N6M3_LIQFO